MDSTGPVEVLLGFTADTVVMSSLGLGINRDRAVVPWFLLQ
jgi:hypothetical protein